jgi:hypothetical protein
VNSYAHKLGAGLRFSARKDIPAVAYARLRRNFGTGEASNVINLHYLTEDDLGSTFHD